MLKGSILRNTDPILLAMQVPEVERDRRGINIKRNSIKQIVTGHQPATTWEAVGQLQQHFAKLKLLPPGHTTDCVCVSVCVCLCTHSHRHTLFSTFPMVN